MNFGPLKDFLDELPSLKSIPGCDCSVHYKGEEIFRHTSGYADTQKRTPITNDTLYYIYSASKVITCVAAMQLYEKGKFLLYDLVSDYLPEFGDVLVKHTLPDGETMLKPPKNPIKIIDLFTMSAGLNYNLNDANIKEVVQRTGGRAPTAEIARAIAKIPLEFEPGTRWGYSLCHDVLAALVELISGKKFADYIQENIFRPLGMNRSGYEVTGERLEKMASLYEFDSVEGRVVKRDKINGHILGSEFHSGGAGVISCVDDYITFIHALYNRGIGINGNKILSWSTIELMRTNQLNVERQKDFNWHPGYGYGLGVRTHLDPAASGSASSYREFGWSGAAGAYVHIDPENQLGIYYAQHMLGGFNSFVHPRLRNIIYSCIF